MGTRILIAIDPGDVQSGYVKVAYDCSTFEVKKIIDKGKVENSQIYDVLNTDYSYDLAVEMIASYGMAVGATVFETCVKIGQFIQFALDVGYAEDIQRVYRKDEKLTLCHSLKAKDANITQALIDRYAPGQPNMGKGTKNNPGFFYGFKKDVWQAFAVAVTYLDMKREVSMKNG